MTYEEAKAEAAKQGYRIWTLGQGIDTLWLAKLYRPVRNAEVPFSADGIGSTEAHAIMACLNGPPSRSLYDEDTMYLRAPPKAKPTPLAEAAAARQRFSQALAR